MSDNVAMFLIISPIAAMAFALGDSKPDPAPVPKPSPVVPKPRPNASLAEVNAARAKRGLPPFKEDMQLTKAAEAAAKYRADRLMAGHTRDDFAFLPEGVHADAAGCGALPDSWGWGTCCTYERFSFAGAGWSRGRDGKRYMHIFVRR